MDTVAAVIVLAGLVLLLVVVSRQYGAPRLYMRPVVALWVIAVLFAVLVLWLALT